MTYVYDRLATWSVTKWALLWLALYLCFALLIVFLNGTHHYRLAKSGIKTVGVVTATDPDNHRVVQYSYTVNQHNYVDGESVGDRFDQLQIGDPVEVFYLPDNPKVSCICNPTVKWGEDRFSTLIAPLMFSTFILIVSLIKARGRNSAHGRQTP